MKTWHVEKSYKLRAPDYIKAPTPGRLRTKLQSLADTYRPRPGSPALGRLTFRYEFDDKTDEVKTVYAYFHNRHGKLSRFMRLSRSA